MDQHSIGKDTGAARAGESGPGYTIRFESRTNYLYAFVTGEQDSVQKSLSYANEIAAECKAKGYAKVLVEEDFKTELTLPETFHVAGELPAIAGNIKVAFIDRQLDHLTRNIVGLMLAVSRGLNARIFENVTEAEEWLA